MNDDGWSTSMLKVIEDTIQYNTIFVYLME